MGKKGSKNREEENVSKDMEVFSQCPPRFDMKGLDFGP